MRLAGATKMGFYPTTDKPIMTQSILDRLIRPTVFNDEHIVTLDPCAGEGVFLDLANQAMGVGQVLSYAVEDSKERAQAIKGAYPYIHATHAAWEQMFFTNDSVSLLLLNPPYDLEAGDPNQYQYRNRLEYTFLQDTEDKLTPGGVLVYIVPSGVLKMQNVARHLSSRFYDITVWANPATETQYDQVIIMGYKNSAVIADYDTERRLQKIGERIVSIMPIDVANDGIAYTVRPVKVSKNFKAFKHKLSENEIVEMSLRESPLLSKEWHTRTSPKSNVLFNPLVPFKIGHISRMMSSGIMPPSRIGNLLIRGKTKKPYTQVPEDKEDTRVYRQQFVSTIASINLDTGELSMIDDTDGLQALMEEHATTLAESLAEQFEPVYTGNPDPALWRKLAAVMPYKKLPGRDAAGLLDEQKHIVLACYESIKRHKVANMVAQMGSGKTVMGLGLFHLVGNKAIVICPSHLVEKWQREVEEALPHAKAIIIESVGDAQAIMDNYKPGDVVVAILSKERAKLGPGWVHATVKRNRIVHDRRTNTSYVELVHSCPKCGTVVLDKEGVTVDDMGKKPQKCAACKEPMYEFNGYNRWPVARYIRDKMAGFFDVLIADEVHQFKGKSTDQGTAFHHLTLACKNTVTLTGTIFGGNSTSIFWLMYRLLPKVREEFKFNGEQDWAEKYGRLQKTVKTGQEEYGAYAGRERTRVFVKEIPGVSPAIVEVILPTTMFTKVADLGHTLPPMTESVIRVQMSEDQRKQYHALEVDLESLMKSREKGSNSWASVYLQNCLARPNSGFREETVMRKTEEGYEEWRVLPAVVDTGELLPKEEALINTIKVELAQGRKTVVYCRQTGTRDIQPRLAEIMNAAGIKAVVLPCNVTARKREKWIIDNAADCDVLIVNPRKVETGLDLIMFQNAIFYEIEYSLYTLWQAMFRLWRITQTRGVKVMFMVYDGTLEAKAFSLMQRKFVSASALYGDDAISAIEQDESDGDLLGELIRKVLEDDDDFKIDGMRGVFQKQTKLTFDPMGGAPSQTTPVIRQRGRARMTMAEMAQIAQPRQRVRVRSVPTEQVAMF